ncbi:MAG: SMP-30/gluconolactonase/LRE family protein [Candidatus Cloacimonetes bacterium]|nr:SMP-30/gluconolactonase/LRE family protein [Candidatus Cloacimonadota bacterium]
MKKQGLILVLFICLLIFPFTGVGQQRQTYQISLVKLWETQAKLIVPESVIRDPVTGYFLVSNINGSSSAVDGNGFISRLNESGEIVNLKWVKGLNAPKGMAIHERILYVTDITRLISIDLDKGKIIKQYEVPGSRFLNDVVTDDLGNVYISDSSPDSRIIYRLHSGKIEKWLESERLNRPNGLFFADNILYIGSSGDGKIKTVDLQEKEVKILANIGLNIDGLFQDRLGNIFTSNWSGIISCTLPSGKTVKLLDTTEESINTADIGYWQERDILLIPTFFGNTIAAYQINYSEQ